MALITRPQEFERELKVATAGMSPEAISKLLAQTAHEALEEAIASGDASPVYRRFVNGREGVPEEAVVPPGPIVYRFEYQTQIATFALAWARDNSPVESGRYRDSWFILVDDEVMDPEDVPPAATMLITNDAPYHRKIELGRGGHFSVPPGIVERLQQAIIGEFGNIVQATVRYDVELAGGYVLKGRGKTKRHHAGESLTYPALEIAPL